MSKFEKVRIKELGKIVTGNTPVSTDETNYGGKYPFIKPTDMTIDQKHVFEYDETYSEKSYERFYRSYIPKGATGVVTIGTVGEKMFQAHEDCFTNQSVNCIISDDKYFDKDYIFYLMKFNLPKVLGANPGTASGRHHVSKSNFSSIKVDITKDLQIQKKIAKILSNYDDLIENNLKRIKLLEESTRLTYEEWFLRFRIDGEKLEIDNEIGLPFGWEKEKLGDYVTIVDNRGKTPPIETDRTEYPLIEVNALNKTNRLVDYGLIKKYVSKETFDSWFRARPKKYDTLISTVGSIAETAMFLRDKGNIAQNIIALQGQNISKLYLYQMLTIEKERIKGLNIGGAQPSIKVPHLLGIKIVIPDILIQNRFDKIINPISDEVEVLSKQNQLLKEARDILLPRLMTGMIDVEDMEVAI